jgi:UDP-N-acetyl-D-glucosamine dehydrogenase
MSIDLVVAGLGYVGLPLARQACAAGLSVVGYDVSAAVVSGVAAGRSHVHDVSDVDVATMLVAGFVVTEDPAVIGTANTVVLCVPTGLTSAGTPDLSAVRAVAEAVAARLGIGMLVVLESTSYPGTTDEVVRPILEGGSGLRAGEDFHLAFSPERVDPGNARFGIKNTPKIVSGHTPLCAKYCAAFYGRFVDSVVVARGTREAEMAKLLENTYRYVNIALVNEVTMFCDKLGIDVWDVLHCAATKPFGFAAFTPGPGVGGHCVPIDPLYLSSKAAKAGFSFSMLSAARDVNSRMPGYVVDRALEILAESGTPVHAAEILLLGVTYKPDVPDLRESPAVEVANRLGALGARVAYHDPCTDAEPAFRLAVRRVCDLDAALASADLTILLQDHAFYDPVRLSSVARSLFDTKGKVAGTRVELL